ncbi:C69 family dipeptidase [Chloroflexi bacterium TSY]|nr:C69 family dipeptidase [Chloroflexi bacterium TSY]
MYLSCDTMVALGNATQNGQTIFAKNSDRPANECQPLVLREKQRHRAGSIAHCQFVELPQVDISYRHVGSRPYWCWGYEHGFNEHQVVIGNEALPSKLAPFAKPKLIGMEILRLGLERSRSAAEAVEVMADLITRYGQGKFDNDADVRTYDNGFIIADPREAYILETAGHDWVVKRVEKPIGISNVHSIETDWTAISPEAERQAQEKGWWLAQPDLGPFNFAEAYSEIDRTQGSGPMRRARSCAILSHRAGGIDVQTMIKILSDHGSATVDPAAYKSVINPGTGICVHGNLDGGGGNTAASLVADLCADGSRLPVYWCSFYSPCLSLFFPVLLEGTLPSILSIGDSSQSEQSPWWQFYQLSMLARSNSDVGVSLVRETWTDFQSKLFISADQVSVEGQRLINLGQCDEASTLLSQYMSENVDTMLRVVEGLLETLTQEAIVTSSF